MQNRKLLAIFAALFAVLLVMAAPVALAGGGDKDGDADSDSSTSYTEDSDSDGVGDGISDDGDNAHPSGKDKSVEKGGSGTQGKSESNPDDSKGPMRSEGQPGDDKANGPGGSDIYDQDGNNGCGNDDDFDDDNNGWCGKPTSTGGGGGETPCVDDMDTIEDECDEGDGGGGGDNTGGDTPGDIVLDDVLERPASGGGTGTGPEVLGTRQHAGTEDVAGSALPFTGAALIPITLLGLGLIGGGSALRRRNR